MDAPKITYQVSLGNALQILTMIMAIGSVGWYMQGELVVNAGSITDNSDKVNALSTNQLVLDLRTKALELDAAADAVRQQAIRGAIDDIKDSQSETQRLLLELLQQGNN